MNLEPFSKVESLLRKLAERDESNLQKPVPHAFVFMGQMDLVRGLTKLDHLVIKPTI